jgi:hypothetical protein
MNEFQIFAIASHQTPCVAEFGQLLGSALRAFLLGVLDLTLDVRRTSVIFDVIEDATTGVIPVEAGLDDIAFCDPSPQRTRNERKQQLRPTWIGSGIFDM